MHMKKISSHQIMTLFLSDENDNESISSSALRINNEDGDCECSVEEIFLFYMENDINNR